MPPKQEKRKIPKRSAGLVISIPAPRPVEDDPSLDLFREAKEAAKALSPTPRTPPTSRTPPTNAAPERDFARVANSIVREAVAGGYFVGKSKQLYDYLYTLTRGAIVPKQSVTISKPTLMRGSDIGSERTLLKNLAHLKSIGLVEVDYTDGKHEGNKYTVYLPEEVGLKADLTPRTPPTPRHPRHARTELPPVPPVESGVGYVGVQPVESTLYGTSKTLFKTIEKSIDDDDAALAGLVATMKGVARELTGKEPSLAEADRWREVGEVLVAELKIAAARTTVSSVPSFLAEHLRRRLWKVDKRQAQAEGRELPDQAMNTAPTVDASKCPDCAGSGWHYPQGMEKGVSKCRHEKLSVSEQGEESQG